MRTVVLDQRQTPLIWLYPSIAQFACRTAAFAHAAETREHITRIRAMTKRVHCLLKQRSARIAVDRENAYVAKPTPRFAKTILHGHSRQSGPVLDAAKALLFRRRDKLAVNH